MSRELFVILGNQLFPPSLLDRHGDTLFFMAEDVGLCTYVKHHQQKIVLFLSAMRSYADELRGRGMDIRYHKLGDVEGKKDKGYTHKLATTVNQAKKDGEPFGRLAYFEVEDRFMEEALAAFADEHGLEQEVLPSPMFLTTREQFAEYNSVVKRPFMADFYKRQRKRLDVLMTKDGKPRGGQWSFDADNRKKLPKRVAVPERVTAHPTEHTEDVIALVQERFGDHPGDAAQFWLPTTRRQVLAWLDDFFEHRFKQFGDYEDALSTRDPVLFHSVLSPSINLGLVTPDEVIQRALDAAEAHDVPINSLEGFVRQIIGWREFIRGIYRHYGEQQDGANFWGHTRKLKPCWYAGDTGLPPLDDVIRKAQRYGWAHHIERLMIAGNLMLLCEVEPHAAYTWFMEMFVDSSDWVMGPNVYGMAIFSDGGVFATKPYICGANYVLKMSDYPRGDWCDVMDGLYWRFVDKHRDFFESQPRLNMMTRTLEKIDGERKRRIFGAAEAFIEKVTR